MQIGGSLGQGIEGWIVGKQDEQSFGGMIEILCIFTVDKYLTKYIKLYNCYGLVQFIVYKSYLNEVD